MSRAVDKPCILVRDMVGTTHAIPEDFFLDVIEGTQPLSALDNYAPITSVIISEWMEYLHSQMASKK